MCATHTQDVDATVEQAEAIREAGGALVRVAVDSPKDVEALAEVRRQTKANLVVDLQESYRLAETVAPHVDKVRYNPGHLWHHEKDEAGRATRSPSWWTWPASTTCAIRIGVNCGSVDPEMKARHPDDDVQAMVESALEHCRFMDDLGFDRYVVSLKDSHPRKVIEANRRFAEARPEVPLHLGVTEAGMPPEGIIKTRVAFEQLLSRGIGDTLRVSLTLPNSAQARGDRRSASRSWPTSPPAATARCRSSTTTRSTSSPARPARASRTRSSWSSPSR